ncbi:membrane-bound O-acyltransferase family MBOAT [Leptospira inadai serovar Lyme str. 10]|uniref:Membrane-bound O-acyltransferase family MBOAT n=2 Tax=Leptospira inadai serovar Lyme TaxID=293084 RepID=V6I0C6_9LEPT|nr:MBOAT family O-acyltransferase [Leptospira inadai]EQA38724.1 membrane-bound O-acyltransferase family MBOAT [Leptospira inadai serovar Lyme str. 10]PNV72394.1 MBOAT family protein [Leptospira inadai serovar Lyme]
MLFHSLGFLLFFGVVYFLYNRFNTRGQNLLLLVSGLAFYVSWGWQPTLILVFSVLGNFLGGLWLSKAIDSRKSLVAGILIGSNLALLGVFKYSSFGAQIWNDLVFMFGGEGIRIPKLLLPLGISFYTFHNISYIVEIRINRIRASTDLVQFCVYDLFFPLLLIGPIERPNSLLPQIANPRMIENEEVWAGLWLFSWGIFKKVFVGDNLLFFVEKVLQPGVVWPDGIVWWLAFVMSLQLYADFSGYTDAARGLARMLGFKLTNNFNFPYLASNPTEFWKRWHISLSSWLRDYIYIPLGGNRLGLVRQILNIMFVWLLGGLWHGAAYGFLVWGLFCGLQISFYIIGAKTLGRAEWTSNIWVQKTSRFVGTVLTWTLFSFGLILFNITSPSDWLPYFHNAFSGYYWSLELAFKVLFFGIPLIFVDILQIRAGGSDEFFSGWSRSESFLKYSVIAFLFALLFMSAGVFEKKVFFYFQF